MESNSTGRGGLVFLQRRGVRLAITGILAALSALILGGIVFSQRDTLLSFDWQFKPASLMLSFAVFSLDLLLVATIWGSIMNALGNRLPGGQHFRVYTLSNVSKRLPGTIWYVASRAHFYRGSGIPGRLTALASGVEFVVAIVSSILISLLFAIPALDRFGLSVAALVSVVLLGIIVLNPRILGWLLRRAGADGNQFSYRNLILWIAGYILAWILSGIVWYLVGNTFVDLPADSLWYIIGSLGLMNIVTSLLYFLPSNFGAMEIGMSLLLSTIMPEPVAVVLTLAARVLITAFEILWALLMVWF